MTTRTTKPQKKLICTLFIVTRQKNIQMFGIDAIFQATNGQSVGLFVSLLSYPHVLNYYAGLVCHL